MTLPAALVVFTCIVTAYLLGRADGRRWARPAGQQPVTGPPAIPQPPPGPEPQTLIVPPCGCVNTFTRTEVIRCPHHQARHDAQQAAQDPWAAEWNERLHKP